jgi:hypothetical protein
VGSPYNYVAVRDTKDTGDNVQRKETERNAKNEKWKSEKVKCVGRGPTSDQHRSWWWGLEST